ncbi:hypothetical protein ACFL59_08550 [Planctomycetota bacterium]
MPIAAVLNGYYRSGTTFLWNYARATLRDHTCLQQPLHPRLASLLQAARTDNVPDPLHGLRLWEEYLGLQQCTLERLLRNHPNTTEAGIASEGALHAYLDVLHSLPEKLVLQPNTLHFYLDVVAERYGARLVHVVRHPLDVMASIERAYLRVPGSAVKELLKRIARPYGLPQAFDVEKEYRWIVRHTGRPHGYYDNWKLRYLVAPFSFLHKLAVVWTLSNYYALRTLERRSGLLLVYEELVSRPEERFPELSRFLGGEFKEIPPIKPGTVGRFSESALQRFRRAVAEAGIEKEYAAIVRSLGAWGPFYAEGIRPQ